MTRQDSWIDLAREPAIGVTALARIQELAPRLRVSVELSEERLRLAFGKATLELVSGFAASDKPGQRAGSATVVPPAPKDATAIVTALARAAEAASPPRPHAPGFRPPFAVAWRGFHATSGRASVVWIALDLPADEGASPLRLHLLLPPGKTRGWLHMELPRGAARRDRALATFARSLRDGWPPRKVPGTDLRCASAAPWLTVAALDVPEDIDLGSGVWGGSALFATRSEGEATILVRIDGPGRSSEVARIEASRVAFYPSPTGAHVLLETCKGVPNALGEDLTAGHAVRELLEVATGRRTLLVEKHELFAFGDTSGAASWSADGRRVAMSGRASFAGGERSAVLVYDVPSGVFVDATPIEKSFLFSHWEGSTAWLRDGAPSDALWFRWEPGRSGPLADAVLGRTSPSGRFALVATADRTRVLDRHAGAYAPPLPASLAGCFWAGDAWVTDEDEPRVFDLASGRYRYLAPASQVLRARFAETAPLVIFHDGAGFQWGSAPELGGGAATTIEHPTPSAARRALAERRARHIEEASLLAEDDESGEARRAITALETRLRAEAALSAGTVKAAEGGEDALEAAVTAYETAVYEAPELYAALHDCAVALGRLGRDDERLRVAALLCERFPISSGAWLVRSIALHKAGDAAAALDAIEHAIGLEAEGVDLAQRRARAVSLLHQRACVHVARGSLDAAIADVGAILFKEPWAKARLVADDDLAVLRSHPLLRSAPVAPARRSPAKPRASARPQS